MIVGEDAHAGAAFGAVYTCAGSMDDKLALALQLSLEQHKVEEQARVIAKLEAADAAELKAAEAAGARAQSKHEKAKAKQSAKPKSGTPASSSGEAASSSQPNPSFSGMTLCISCGQKYSRRAFSTAQLRKSADERRCRTCCNGDISAGVESGTAHDASVLPTGTKIYITGLKHQLEYNGRPASIISYDSATGRYAVRMSSDVSLKVKAANCVTAGQEQTPMLGLSRAQKQKHLSDMELTTEGSMRQMKMIEENPLRGFKRINWTTNSPGKLRGPERELFRAGLCEIHSNIMLACNDTFDELPLYSRLSPHQRLELVAEVAEGVLCDSTPLPPETPEHHSAFLAVYEAVRVAGIDVEIDSEGMTMEYDAEGSLSEASEDDSDGEVPEVITPWHERRAGSVGLRGQELQDHLRKSSEDMVASGTRVMQEEQLQANKSRALRKRSKETTADVVREAVKEMDHAHANPVESREAALDYMRRSAEMVQRVFYMPSMFPTLELMPRSAAKRAARLPDQIKTYRACPTAFYWRRLLWEMFAEQCDDARKRHSGIEAHLAVECTECRRPLWEHLYNQFFQKALHLDKEEDVLVRGSFEDNGGPRSKYLHDYVKSCAKDFNSTWLAARTVRAERVLIILGIDDTWRNLASLAPDNRADCKRMWTLALQGNELLQSLPPKGPPGSNDDTWKLMKSIDTFKRLGWLHFWHEALARDRCGYGCLEARLEALQNAAAAESSAGVTAISPTEFCDNEVPYVEGDIEPNGQLQLVTPSSWMQSKLQGERHGLCSHCGASPRECADSKLSLCAGCGLVAYCSKGCQRAAWKAGHKAECKRFQAELNRNEDV